MEPGVGRLRPARSPLAEHWQLDPSITFLNHGSFGATPTILLEEQNRIRLQMEEDPVRFFERESHDLQADALNSLAQFLNADVDGLTFCHNATGGVNTILRSLELEPGDEIIVPNHSYQACWNAVDFVCQRSGAKTVVVDIPFRVENEDQLIGLLLDAITPRTVLAMIDTVTSPTGLRMPFERLVDEFQSRNIDVLLDAAHGPGIVPLNLQLLDAAYITGNCHKWLCTPKGSAFLHIREDRKDRIKPLTIGHGHSSVASKQEKFRFEFDWQGTHDPSAFFSIPTALEFMQGLVPDGFSGIIQHNNKLARDGRRLLCEVLDTTPPVPDSMIAAMAAIELPGGHTGPPDFRGDPLHNSLLDEHGIQVPVFPWQHHQTRYMRISSYLYNSENEYEFLAEKLQNYL